MIQYATINGKEYPFKFGMAEVLLLSTGQGLEFDDTLRAIHMNIHLFYKLFAMASEKGARRHAEENKMLEKQQIKWLTLNEQQLEDAIDDDPAIFDRLQEIFQESVAFKRLEENIQKKMKAPTGQANQNSD